MSLPPSQAKNGPHSAREADPQHLDIAAFARKDTTLSGDTPLSYFTRLTDAFHDAHRDAPEGVVSWTVHGHIRTQKGGAFEIWLDVDVSTEVPLTCQLCLETDHTPLSVERSFRFVGDERTAAQLDADADDDVLVISRNFDLLGLIEDELLLDLPLVPQHDICPTRLPLPDENDFISPDNIPVAEPAADEPNPFSALQALKSTKDSH